MAGSGSGPGGIRVSTSLHLAWHLPPSAPGPGQAALPRPRAPHAQKEETTEIQWPYQGGRCREGLPYPEPADGMGAATAPAAWLCSLGPTRSLPGGGSASKMNRPALHPSLRKDIFYVIFSLFSR